MDATAEEVQIFTKTISPVRSHSLVDWVEGTTPNKPTPLKIIEDYARINLTPGEIFFST
ncbi:hypothetical protein [Nostoc sp. LEGE 12450]|uniref:hypothetical protein n=1 Tax=Nostoc sp. LEGE 12450 TaxID=1828643 RepID=UPI00187ECE32|nr:hypothetical protein [Nostoc sp. LEGE 12450]MBE8986485.1 hypothetical protein [Nostoc sp. LEGE 12450]